MAVLKDVYSAIADYFQWTFEDLLISWGILRPRRICDIYDFFAPFINLLSTNLLRTHACFVCQIPANADAGSLPIFSGDSVPLQFKASTDDGKSSTRDLFFNDSFEEKTKKLQLLVRTTLLWSVNVQCVSKKSPPATCGFLTFFHKRLRLKSFFHTPIIRSYLR